MSNTRRHVVALQIRYMLRCKYANFCVYCDHPSHYAPLSNASTQTSPTRGVQVWSPARSVTDAEADEFLFSLRESLPQYGRDFDDDPISDTGD